MQPPLNPQQVQALTNLHKELAALSSQEGKGGPSTAATVAAINADLIALYKALLGLPSA